jgi:cytochrome c biogenesis protein CcmG/thiol:disulfide interchange protein DsbE
MVRLNARRVVRALLAASVLASLAASRAPAQAGTAATPAPEITLADGINGVSARTTLASLRGKPVVVAFWIPICPHCQDVASALERIRTTYGPRGVEVVVVSHGKKPYVDAWLKRKGLAFGVGFDWSGHTAARYGVRSLPGLFLVARDGTLRASGIEAVEAALRADVVR